MWGVRIEINVCPSVKYGCQCANLHETDNHPVTFVDISYTDYYPVWMKNVETYGAEFHLQPQAKYGFHSTNFQKTHHFSIYGGFYIPKFNKIIQEICTVGQIFIDAHKYDCRHNDFHETCSCLANCYTESLY